MLSTTAVGKLLSLSSLYESYLSKDPAIKDEFKPIPRDVNLKDFPFFERRNILEEKCWPPLTCNCWFSVHWHICLIH